MHILAVSHSNYQGQAKRLLPTPTLASQRLPSQGPRALIGLQAEVQELWHETNVPPLAFLKLTQEGPLFPEGSVHTSHASEPFNSPVAGWDPSLQKVFTFVSRE